MGFFDKLPYNKPHKCSWCGKYCEEMLRIGIDVPLWQCGHKYCTSQLIRLYFECKKESNQSYYSNLPSYHSNEIDEYDNKKYDWD